MRVLHVTDTYLPTLGGIELHVRDLAVQQQAVGHDVAVLTRTPEGAAEGAPVQAGPSEPHPVLRLANRRRRSNLVAAVAARLAAHPVDAVHAHSSLYSPLAWAATVAAAQAAVPALLTVHSVAPGPGTPRVARAAFRRAFDGGVAAECRLSAVSTAAAAALAAALPPSRTPVAVLPNAIDPDYWAPGGGGGPRRCPLTAPLTVVSVLRFAARKRPLALVKILAELRRCVPAEIALRAVLVGDGPLRPLVSSGLRAAGLHDWVELPGALPRAAVRDVLHSSDLYLAPATLESFGLAALEARCAGLPVLGRQGTGLADFVRDGIEGYLVRSDQAMAARAGALLASPRRLAALRHNVLTWPPVSTWVRTLRLTEQLYSAAAEPDWARADPVGVVGSVGSVGSLGSVAVG